MDIWRQCAEDYLAKMWFGQGELDRQLVKDFSTGLVTCEKLRDLCSPLKYGVARTIPGHGKEVPAILLLHVQEFSFDDVWNIASFS